MTEEQALAGGFGSGGQVVRVGDTVRRPWRPATPAVQAVLERLADVAPGVAPEPKGRDEQGREILSWMPGEVAVPPFPEWAATEEYLASLAHLMRTIHDALDGWVPPADAEWPPELRDPAGGPIIAHGDICPENVICENGRASAIIDWEFAAPGRRVWDLVSTARLCVPFTAPSRRDPVYDGLDVTARLRLFADEYGAGDDEREAFREVLELRKSTGERFVLGRVARGEKAFVDKWATTAGRQSLSDETAFVEAVPHNVLARDDSMSPMTWPRMDGLRTLELGSPGALRQELTGLVLDGVKIGTAGLADLDYTREDEELEHVGEKLVLIGDDGARLGLVEITAVEVVPFAEVTDEFARSEGEGFEDRDQWAAAHRSYWERHGETVDDKTPVVCVNFRFEADKIEGP